MNKIHLIDADLMDGINTTHPNLALAKLSAWHKSQGDDVSLLRDIHEIHSGDIVKISKVFSWSKSPDLPQHIYETCKIEGAGTGYFYDNSPRLPNNIEHIMPDYHLYDEYIKERVQKSPKRAHPENYKQFSIGFLTRGCFRKCSFCVNKNYDKAVPHSPLSEFHDKSRPYIRLWDDNFLAVNRKDFLRIINDVRNVNKPVVWQQGLDVRLMTEEKADIISTLRYFKRNYIFALDDDNAWPEVERGLQNWTKYMQLNTHVRSMYGKAYVLTGYKKLDASDIKSLLDRCKKLMVYGIIPMPMFYNGTKNIKQSEYAWLYLIIKNWTNPLVIGKQSLMMYAEKYRHKIVPKLKQFASENSWFNEYLHMRYCDLKMV